MHFWIVKGSPSQNRGFAFIQAGRTNAWRTKKPPKLWEPGDRVFIWGSSPLLELLALAEFRGVTGKYSPAGETSYRLHYFTGVLPQPVSAAELKQDPITQSANFLKRSVAQGVLRLTAGEGQRMYQLLREYNPKQVQCWGDIPDAVGLDLPDIDETFSEGGRKIRSHLVRERQPALVAAKKRKVLRDTGRSECEVCGFDFKEKYGPLGANFCEVHHRQPRASLETPRANSLDDVAVVCANCHRVIHRITPFIAVGDLRDRLAGA